MTDFRRNQASGVPSSPVWVRLLQRLFDILLPLAVLAAGVAVAVMLLKSTPRARRTPPARQARLVTVRPVVIADYHVRVAAMGTVIPRREVRLNPLVSGEIVAVHPDFEPGGLFSAGTRLLRLDPTDYELAVRDREAAVIGARGDLRIEEGRQAVARREYELLGLEIDPADRDLVLRRPQLEQAQAALASAEAALGQARLDLRRTEVTAPFNAVIRERPVNLGMQVGPTTTVATLAGTDTFWVELLVPASRLRWLDIPVAADDPGAPVALHHDTAWSEGVTRGGHVVRLLSDLEDKGRMARILVAVDDPLARRPENIGKPRLLLGDYLRAEIAGRTVAAAAAVPRELIRDSRFVWVMDAADRLEIRPVEIAFTGREVVCVQRGLRAGERLVVTDLAAPVAEMPLRLAKERPDTAAAGETSVPGPGRERESGQ